MNVTDIDQLEREYRAVPLRDILVELAEARAMAGQLTEALEWYADEQSYDDHGHWVDRRASVPEWLSMVPIEQDRGDRARAALAAAPPLRGEPMAAPEGGYEG